jgi:hypothetical protein
VPFLHDRTSFASALRPDVFTGVDPAHLPSHVETRTTGSMAVRFREAHDTPSFHRLGPYAGSFTKIGVAGREWPWCVLATDLPEQAGKVAIPPS